MEESEAETKKKLIKVFITDVFGPTESKRCKLVQADALLCNQLKSPAPDGIPVYDANSERVAGTWEAWDQNKKIIESLFHKVPALRYVNGIDLMPAMLKTTLWANRKFGYLIAWLKKHKEASPIVQADLYPCNPWKVRLKYLKTKFTNRSKLTVSQMPVPESAVFAFMAENLFQFNILLPVARKLGKDKVCWIRTPANGFRKEELALIESEWNCWNAPAAPRKFLPGVPLFRLNKQELFCLNAWVNDLTPISNCLHWGELLFQSSVQVLVTLAQENTHVGHILCAQAAKHGKHTVNTMNGIKFADAINSGASFDAWIVWDDSMKKLLHEQGHIPEKQLRVVGSLQQDALANPVYSESLPLSEDDIKHKRIVTVVSTRDLRLDKLEALDTLYQWAEQQSDVIILYRPHPAETKEYYYLPQKPTFRFELIIPRNATHKQQSLKDQLLVSDLVVHFGSTVGIEALWMGVPSITYEKKPQSVLYCADGKAMIHLSEKNQLYDVLNQLEKKKQVALRSAKPDAMATAYADIIRSYAS